MAMTEKRQQADTPVLSIFWLAESGFFHSFSPVTFEVSRDLCQKSGYTFTFLSDPNVEVIRRYDLVHAGQGVGGHDIALQSSWSTRPEQYGG
jgi:hypothetical protein